MSLTHFSSTFVTSDKLHNLSFITKMRNKSKLEDVNYFRRQTDFYSCVPTAIHNMFSWGIKRKASLKFSEIKKKCRTCSEGTSLEDLDITLREYISKYKSGYNLELKDMICQPTFDVVYKWLQDSKHAIVIMYHWKDYRGMYDMKNDSSEESEERQFCGEHCSFIFGKDSQSFYEINGDMDNINEKDVEIEYTKSGDPVKSHLYSHLYTILKPMKKKIPVKVHSKSPKYKINDGVYPIVWFIQHCTFTKVPKT
jgi:hypothetical protein